MDINNLILNNLNYSVILFDESLVLKFLNLPAQELTGFSDRFLNKLTLSRFFNNNAYIEEKVKNVMQTGEGFIEFEYKFQNKNPTRYVILEISKIVDENNKSYLLISLKDITRFKEMDHNIKNEERIEDLSRFIAEMSHEIRNPLGGIKASAAYLKRKFNEPDLNNFLEIIIKESTRINNLIEDLLALSKKHKIKTSAVNINKIINEIIIMEQAEFSVKNIEIIKEFDPSLPKIYASENALVQVFLNMIKNSVYAIKKPDSGIIKIITKLDYTRNNPKFIKIEFIDNGCGISKNDMKNIFVPFFTTKEKGSGLGLAVSQKIIHEHGGFIDISSVKNRGTVVSVYIPIEKFKTPA
ncbi:MAG: two-component system sensor histidine kinase NtrB [bacterium]|jgi:two-component system nitrogen regulation sensor histidine kinase GlnL